MGPSNRPEGSLNLNLSGLSPIGEPNMSSSTAKSPFTGPKSNASTTAAALGQMSRVGAGSPLHESAQRLFPKRTRELQTPTGTVGNIWGPPTSGTSTPLFEIPESPNQDGFPDLVPLTETGINSPARRGRAGTLPSRISPTVTGSVPATSVLTSKTSRPTPSTSPFRPGSASEKAFNSAAQPTGTSALLSRLRAGSMPQRASLFGGSGFMTSQSPFVTSWNSRTRAATLTSISSAEDPSSPPPSGLGKEDPGVRTLDYLGLAETPASENARLADHDLQVSSAAFLTSLSNKNNSRFRSFSVNTNNHQFGSAPLDNGLQTMPGTASGTMTPSAAAALEAEYEAIQERVRLHNKAVQDFALNASAARPRARTAGLVDTPHRSALRRFGQHLMKDSEADAIHAAMTSGEATDSDLAAALYGLNVQDTSYAGPIHEQAPNGYEFVDDSHSQPSRSLWIGSIPNSTTISTLDTIFSKYGSIESTRVLTHKNCGFVNFDNMQDAVRARQLLNGTEIFPGSGPVRIGFAKAPSNNVTPAAGGLSQSPMPQAGHEGETTSSQSPTTNGMTSLGATNQLADIQSEILEIVVQLGADGTDVNNIKNSIGNSLNFMTLEKEIPPLAEPTTNRVFDAPRLRDIRKRIDNGQCVVEEIEQTAVEMLPEIAELSSDYLGNTVVQKLFEYCSEDIKEEMLAHIAPHLAEIGVHKNGTWAAQKIIDVCRTETEIRAIIDHLRPYTVPLFLDQFGNYVLQCCLRFGPQYNGFLFETMLSQLWEMAQGRFGARAMRACLESHHSTKDQQRMLAAVIALNGVQLATNTNGALLLTWFLDTCTFPRRRSVLAPRLIPHLVQLCTHKVAYLTVLKVVNQRNEPEAREAILQALFFSPNDSTLEQVLKDQSSGVTCVFKILTSPFLDENMRADVVRNITSVLGRIKALPNQGYKRLMDEVGLSARGPAPAPGFGPVNDRSRAIPQPGNGSYANSYPPGMNGLDGMTPQRANSSDAFGYAGYGMAGYPTGYGAAPQYQQGVNQSQHFQGYNSPAGRSNGGYMPNNFAGYNTPPTAVDYRAMQNQSASPVPFTAQMSPMMGNGGGFAQPYIPASNQGNMYGYGGNGVQQSNYNYGTHMQGVHAGGRGRRVCY